MSTAFQHRLKRGPTVPQSREVLTLPLPFCQRRDALACGAAAHRSPCSKYRLSSSMMALITSHLMPVLVALQCLWDPIDGQWGTLETLDVRGNQRQIMTPPRDSPHTCRVISALTWLSSAADSCRPTRPPCMSCKSVLLFPLLPTHGRSWGFRIRLAYKPPSFALKDEDISE